MHLFPSLRHRSSAARGRSQPVVVGLLLASYLTTIVGFPLPAVRGMRLAGEAFPCQSHACGCQSARDCLDRCCCFSPEQKQAWFAAQSAGKAQQPSEAAGGCCSETAVATLQDRESRCCSDEAAASQATEVAGCCSTPESSHESLAVEGGGSPSRVVLFVMAQRCRGTSGGEWFVLDVPVMPPPRLAWQIETQVVARLSAIDLHYAGAQAAPPVPPPRLA